ncbi:HTH of cAMP family transcriptional regulator [Synechococcus sp. RS9916]|nr:HTH of cAMP family transcriptional regulator [Synechococcus sp. RS9916]
MNEWTLQLLRIRHLGQAEQRLHALLSLLVSRLGKRYGEWCSLPFRLTHERIGELIGSTRVTSTRLMSKLRNGEMLKTAPGEAEIRLSPDLINTSPLSF